MPADYLLSVDLGTSHTVAVVVWPDGRTRPLLFDGSPVMPSGVFLDEAGTIHTGRDAERLSPTAPDRFEPNPKQRIGDGTILLGGREIQVTAAFAAILTRVAQQCVEVVGGLPQAVLTCPAAWGERRRGALHDAAAQAGYPPVQIVTEPVAAAHYYTGRLSQPIDPGQALAVFDFGGGTLDIAAVERRGDGSFAVLADGGLPDLGGLDFDAALVAHIGETVSQRDPELWKRLERPGSATEQRDRRTLWNDVRGAKEMLSRSSVAPVTVPGLEQALHLTRGELDQLARPLLSRAVGETQRVLGLAGRRADQLAGLFLVGGSSRMPLVAKTLHEQLGIAPTALEQPELPVSEGAAVAVASPAPVTPPVMSPGPVQSPQTVTQVPTGLPPAGDATMQLRPPAAGRNRRRRGLFIAVAAIVAVLAVTAVIAWNVLTDPYKQREFIDLEEVGDAVPYAAEGNDGVFDTIVRGERAVFFYTVATDTEEAEELHVRALSTENGEPLWDDQVIDGDGWGGGVYASEELLAVVQETEDLDGNTEYDWHFLDWESGKLIRTITAETSSAARSGDELVIETSDDTELSVYDASGNRSTAWKVADPEGEDTMVNWNLVGTPGDLVDQASPSNGDGRIWALTTDGVVQVFDIESRDEIAAEEIETAEDAYFAYNGLMYVTVQKETGYELNAYDIDEGLSRVDSEFVDDRTAGWMVPCGEHRVCVSEEDPEVADVYTWQVYDAEDERIVHEFEDQQYRYIEAVGDRLMVEYYEGDDVRTEIYDKDFETVGPGSEETFDGIDGGSAIAHPYRSSYGLATGKVIGLGVRDGTRHLVRAELEAYDCDASDTHLACLTEAGMQIYRFRED